MKGTAKWQYEVSGATDALYVSFDNRHRGPYRTQTRVLATLDIDVDGHLAGIEILDASSPRKVAKPRSKPAKKKGKVWAPLWSGDPPGSLCAPSTVFTATCPRCAGELKDLVPFQKRPCPSCAAESIQILLTSGAA